MAPFRLAQYTGVNHAAPEIYPSSLAVQESDALAA